MPANVSICFHRQESRPDIQVAVMQDLDEDEEGHDEEEGHEIGEGVEIGEGDEAE
jgi:hypothetical protein